MACSLCKTVQKGLASGSFNQVKSKNDDSPVTVADSETQLLTIKFKWNGVMRSVSSTLVGVSPEIEMALYRLCFQGNENNYVEFGLFSVNIKCYRLGDNIGSAFPFAKN